MILEYFENIEIGKLEMENWKMGNGKLELAVPQSSSATI